MGPVPFERYFQGLQKTSQFHFSMTSSKGSKLRLKVDVKVSKFYAKWRYLRLRFLLLSDVCNDSEDLDAR